jgi:hypothetical protein
MGKTNLCARYHLGQLKGQLCHYLLRTRAEYHSLAKLAKLRRELIAPPSGGGGGPGAGFDVARTGVASVGFVGFPSVVSHAFHSQLFWLRR